MEYSLIYHKRGEKEDKKMRNNRLLYVIIGIVTTLFTAVTVTMWLQVNASITDVRENMRAVCIMQDSQKELMGKQKELLQNHVEHLKETMEYIREDVREIKETINDINRKKK